jgi:hypothetical protein
MALVQWWSGVSSFYYALSYSKSQLALTDVTRPTITIFIVIEE